jgi:hypothetical protein
MPRFDGTRAQWLEASTTCIDKNNNDYLPYGLQTTEFRMADAHADAPSSLVDIMV